MKRKILTVIIVVMVSVLMIACKQKESPVEVIEKDKETMDIKFDEKGVAFDVPDKWLTLDGRKIILDYTEPEENILGQIILSYVSEDTINEVDKISQELNNIPDTDNEARDKVLEKFSELENEAKALCRIVTIDKSVTEANARKALFNEYDIQYLIGKEDRFEFYLLYKSEPATEGLTEEVKKDYAEYYGEIEKFKSLITVYKPISETEKVGKNKLEFATKTLDGSEVDSSILASSKITMVNVWGTFCQPCIDEMPDLQNLYEEVQGDGVNIIGIVSDTPDKDNEELAKKIVSTKGVKYINVIPDESIIQKVLNNISAVPTTLFVDEEGNIIGDLVVGARSKEEYKKEINDRLEIINK
jgi:thiol-disulfide isomerase/thioredoxin